MEEKLVQFQRYCEESSIPCRRNEPMARHTTFRTGGPADLFVEPRTMSALVYAWNRCGELGLPRLVVGRGSNLLVQDAGIEGVVFHLGKDFSGSYYAGEGRFVFSAGVSLATVGETARKHGFTGAEFAHGIPGTLGGAIYMNAGAYGGEMSQIVESVIYLRANGSMRICSYESCGFGYRRSAFQQMDGCIVSASLRLKPGDPDAISARMEELRAARLAKQPLDLPSAGSTFKRPREGQLAAAALIDRCGLRGLRMGDAMVSVKHTGFVVNVGQATTQDILALTDIIRTVVLAREGVSLELEVQRVGRGV